MCICLVFARLLRVALERLALCESDFCFALGLSNRRVCYGSDTLVSHLGQRIRPVFSGVGLDLLHFFVGLGILIGRGALGFGDVLLNFLGSLGLVAGRQAQ